MKRSIKAQEENYPLIKLTLTSTKSYGQHRSVAAGIAVDDAKHHSRANMSNYDSKLQPSKTNLHKNHCSKIHKIDRLLSSYSNKYLHRQTNRKILDESNYGDIDKRNVGSHNFVIQKCSHNFVIVSYTPCSIFCRNPI